MSLDHIFRAYDIRGKTGEELTPDVMERIGYAFGANLVSRKAERAILGHDVRTSSPELADAFKQGARKAGVDILDAGLVPYGPVLFKGWQDGMPSAFVTASHLSREWNGVKFAHATGIGYSEEENKNIRDRFYNDGSTTDRIGEERAVGIVEPYKEYLCRQVDVDDVEVLMDCGNGSACIVAPVLFNEAGISAEVINGWPDGTFPQRSSDVTEESLSELSIRMQNGEFDVGIAYDGDADRVAAVDDTGRVLSSEQLAGVLLHQIAEEQDGPVVANVECSRLIEHVADQYGKKVIRVRVGHTYLFKAMNEHDACLGVEKSGHMGVPHILPLDDGIATSLYLSEVVSKLDRPLSLVVDDLPDYYRSRMSYRVPEAEKFQVMQALKDTITRRFDNTNTLDGVRVNKEEGWALIRASNTSPKIRLTIEAKTAESFDDMNRRFSGIIREVFDEFGTAVKEAAEQDMQEEQESPETDGAMEQDGGGTDPGNE